MINIHYKKRKKTFLNDKRLFLLFVAVVLIAFIIIIRLFILQIIRGGKYSDMAFGRHNLSTSIEAKRGEIFIQEFGSETLYPVATNKITYLVYAEPSKIQNKVMAAKVLADNLELDEAELKKTLYKDDPYEPVAHYVSKEIMERIKAYGIKGVGFEEEVKRFYPEKGFGGHILGFVGFDTNKQSGRYGLEGYFDEQLSGQSGYLKGEKDALGRLIPWGDQALEEAVDGTDFVLTVERGIQFFVCNKIKEAVKKYEASFGVVIVMEPNTGKVLAMCSSPDFDPNFYNKEKDQSIFNNPAIFNQYEPGSVFKPITMAAAIDAKLVSPESTYIDEGEVYIEPHTIKNSDLKRYGVQTMTEVLEKSLNTGVVHVVKLLGPKKFREYVNDFGFGNLTDIGLDKEAVGDISSLKKRGEIWSATASYGQGISVTPLQMLNAFNVLANGGKLMRPYIVEKIIGPGSIAQETSPKTIRQVISSRTSVLLRGMLASVVENGHAKLAAVNGYYVGGKTGTAQVSEGGEYAKEKKIATFAGFAPVDNPRFSVLIRLDNPQAVEWASDSAAPIFGEIAKYILNYLKVPSER
ncbi:penicillin-binding protein 2 [Patescibacteria group bacterium]|nr:penicillin-binding protein 2 [Patescibacteria group bacterium]